LQSPRAYRNPSTEKAIQRNLSHFIGRFVTTFKTRQPGVQVALHGGPMAPQPIASSVSTKEDVMSYRLLIVALMAASVGFATQSYAETTVKSSKSNTSDRMGGGGGGKGAAGLTTVKSGKSNTSDRMGGGGGGKGAGQLNPQPEPPGRR
jgi:hypothetical protein